MRRIDKIIEILRKETKKYRVPVVTEMAQRWGEPFYVLISCILSLRTKDAVTRAASERIFSIADSPVDMSRLSAGKIEKAIYPVGFYRTKAKNILRVCRILAERFRSKVPSTIDELLALPGVGRKTANLVVTRGFGKLGICVDTHVHRISNRLGYVRTRTPEQTEFALRKILPKRYWIEYNDLLVTWGQNVCAPVSPFCGQCAIVKYCKKAGVSKSR
ncbi:MAG: endonuclease III [Candidatus Omnitrophica bacterium]|nr:endonuclease III [Candidatus Omnitrophota bacterium]